MGYGRGRGGNTGRGGGSAGRGGEPQNVPNGPAALRSGDAGRGGAAQSGGYNRSGGRRYQQGAGGQCGGAGYQGGHSQERIATDSRRNPAPSKGSYEVPQKSPTDNYTNQQKIGAVGTAAAKYKAAEEVLKRQRNQYLREMLEERGKMLDAEIDKMKCKAVAGYWEKQAEEELRQLMEKLRRFDPKVSSRADAITRCGEAKCKSLFEDAQKEWQLQTEKRVQEAVQEAQADFLANAVANLTLNGTHAAALAAEAARHDLAADQPDQAIEDADMQDERDEAERQKLLDEGATDDALDLEREEEEMDLQFEEDTLMDVEDKQAVCDVDLEE
jgi:hypothetical protein